MDFFLLFWTMNKNWLPGKRQILFIQWPPSAWQCASVVDASVMLDRYGHGCHILGGRRSRSNVRGVWGLGNRATAAFFNCYWSHTNNSICNIPFTMTQSPYEGTMISEMQKYVKIITLILVTLILVCFWAVFIKTQKITREFDFPVWTKTSSLQSELI